jgi:hypothetical protein
MTLGWRCWIGVRFTDRRLSDAQASSDIFIDRVLLCAIAYGTLRDRTWNWHFLILLRSIDLLLPRCPTSITKQNCHQ